jgi:hypothetical protein
VLVNFRESPDLVRRTARERGYTSPVLLDESGDVTGRVDRQGRLVGRAVGPRNWESPEGQRFIEALVDAR